MLFTDKCQNFATDRILEAAFYIDTERGNYMKTIVVCDDVEIERLLLKEIFGSLTVGYQKKVPAGRIKPAFFVSNFWFLSIVFYCNVL